MTNTPHAGPPEETPMLAPTPSIEQLREDLNTLDTVIGADTETLTTAYLRLGRALDELATLRARVAEQDAWRAEREANSDPDVNAARHALRSLTVFTPQTGTTPVNLSEAGDRIAVVIEAYVDQIRWRARAEPLLRAFLDMVIYREEAPVQIYCRAWGDSKDATYDEHAPTCPVVQISTLLGEGGQ